MVYYHAQQHYLSLVNADTEWCESMIVCYLSWNNCYIATLNPYSANKNKIQENTYRGKACARLIIMTTTVTSSSPRAAGVCIIFMLVLLPSLG